MKSIDLQKTVVITSNSPAWSDMVANMPAQAMDQMNAGTKAPQPAMMGNMGRTVDPQITGTHINPIR